MSIEHKAFLFNYSMFEIELKPLIEYGLKSKNIEELRRFIISNKQSLVDTYEGEPLEDDWESWIEDKDVHQYGDFALTKYYSPAGDRGLGDDWQSIQDILLSKRESVYSPVLGIPLGDDEEFFDPGKMGSYFQNFNQIKDNLLAIKEIEGAFTGGQKLLCKGFCELLEEALNEKKGIYVTF